MTNYIALHKLWRFYINKPRPFKINSVVYA
jgi:hypothetical protein